MNEREEGEGGGERGEENTRDARERRKINETTNRETKKKE